MTDPEHEHQSDQPDQDPETEQIETGETGEESFPRDRPLTASVEKLRGELDHWLDVAWSQGERALDAFGIKAGLGWSPAVDVIEAAEEVRVLVDLPGVDPQTVEITLAGNMLTLKGEKPASPCTEGEQMPVRQRPKGRFTRSIPMPVPVDSEKVSAESAAGVLTIRLTKSERAKPRQIPINVR